MKTGRDSDKGEKMNYFASCIYGDYEKYKQIVDDLCLEQNDVLWLLGDIIGGGAIDPEDNFRILDDIMSNSHVKVVLGDHEFAQNMRFLSMASSADVYENWVSFSNELEVSDKALNEYIENNMSQEDQSPYFGVGGLLLSAELSEVVQIGDRYFYLVHGTPSFYREDLLSNWQLQVCTADPNLNVNQWDIIRTDPVIRTIKSSKIPISEKNTITISGQFPPNEAAESIGKKEQNSVIFYSNKVLCIGRRSVDDPLPVVGIDAAGFFVKNVY